jgi:phage terminase small subunit
MAQNGNLTPKQRKFVAAVMASTSVKAAAAASGVGERTAHRWIREENVQRELDKALDATLTDTTRIFVRATSAALQVLLESLRDEKPDSIRLSAAKTVLDGAMKLYELTNISRRVGVIEDTLFEEVVKR